MHNLCSLSLSVPDLLHASSTISWHWHPCSSLNFPAWNLLSAYWGPWGTDQSWLHKAEGHVGSKKHPYTWSWFSCYDLHCDLCTKKTLTVFIPRSLPVPYDWLSQHCVCVCMFVLKVGVQPKFKDSCTKQKTNSSALLVLLIVAGKSF